MENVNKIFQTALATIVFCIGLFLMVTEARIYHDVLTTTREKYKEYNNEMFQQYNIEDREVITYAEIITTLFQSLEYDILVDSTSISKHEHNTDKINGYGIRNTTYRKSYQYDEKGNIMKVIYTGL